VGKGGLAEHPSWDYGGFSYKKNSKRKNLRTKKILWLTRTTFGRGRELPPQPLPEKRSLIQELIEVLAFG
jgi:hypothetical protein